MLTAHDLPSSKVKELSDMRQVAASLMDRMDHLIEEEQKFRQLINESNILLLNQTTKIVRKIELLERWKAGLENDCQ